MDRMNEWITTGERPMPYGVVSFAKSVSGSSKSKGDDDDSDDDDDDDSDDDEDDDDEDDEDDFADLSDDELRAELKKAKASLSKAGGSVKSKRAKIRKLNRELEEAKKPKPAAKKKSDDDDDAPDLDTIRSEAKSEGEKAGVARAKRAEARASLLQAGVIPERVAKAVGLIDLEELDLDDEGLDGIDEAIDELKADWPEMFATKRKRRGSVAGEGDRNGDNASRKTKMSPSERQAAIATGKR